MNLKINYNKIAKDYSIYRNASERIISHIIDKLQDFNPYNFLEIGCGTADHLFALNQLMKKESYGFDQSSEMIREGRKKNPGLNLKVGDVGNKFPYENDYFDFIFSINVIHYIKDLYHYFSESHRILIDGGTILTVTDSAEDIRNRAMSKYFPESVKNDLERYPSIIRITNEMEKVGFRDIEITHTTHTYKIREKELVKFKNKAYSAIRLVSQDCFEKGINWMTEDVRRGRCEGKELYTYIWGIKWVFLTSNNSG